jgi:hypothetical protein
METSARFLSLALLAVAFVCPGAADAANVTIGNVTIARGSSGSFPVTMTGTGVVGAQTDITFDGTNTPIAVVDGRPDCTSASNKPGSFVFHPLGCVGKACTRVRAVLLSTGNLTAIPSGATLFTCRVRVPSGAATGTQALVASNVALSDKSSNAVPVTATNGQVTVTGGGCL